MTPFDPPPTARWLVLLSALLLATGPRAAGAAGAAGTTAATTTLATTASPVERAHARALDLFRHARFAEAYGRFIELANVGHPASARYAIWMCENGTALFGAPWDCASYELEAWGIAANGPARTAVSKASAHAR